MAESVTAAQKLYEKFVMLSRNSKNLTVVMVTAPEPCLVVAVESEDGGVTPLARLLTKPELDEMVPDFDRGAKLASMFHEAIAVDERVFPEDFGDGSVHPLFTEEFLTQVGL